MLHHPVHTGATYLVSPHNLVRSTSTRKSTLVVVRVLVLSRLEVVPSARICISRYAERYALYGIRARIPFYGSSRFGLLAYVRATRLLSYVVYDACFHYLPYVAYPLF
eukprot:scaffold104205_cov18-Prasinocladus_malaysianus.AAC.1